MFLKRRLPYSNPTPTTKHIKVRSLSPYVRVRKAEIEVAGYGVGWVQLRMYFPSTVGRSVEAEVCIEDGDHVERLLFQIQLKNR